MNGDATTRKRKGRLGGAAMMAWMFFANLFDPKKVAAMEHIDTQRRIGPEAQRITATPAGGLSPDKSQPGAASSAFPGEGRSPASTRP